jgi:prepilin-type N-terminal cleavage/methylation domain-containing protein
MKKTITTQKSQSGYSIIEITVVLAIMLFLAAIVFTAVAKVRQKSTINAYVSDIASIRSAVDSFSAGLSPDRFTYLNEYLLVNLGLMPSHMIRKGADFPLVSPLGAPIHVNQTNWLGSTRSYLNGNKFYTIQFTTAPMPRSVCVGVVVKAGMSFSAVEVNSHIVKQPNSPTVDVVRTTESCRHDYNNLQFYASAH